MRICEMHWRCVYVNVCVEVRERDQQKENACETRCEKQDVPHSLYVSATNVFFSAASGFLTSRCPPLLSPLKVSLRHKSKKKSKGGKLSP